MARTTETHGVVPVTGKRGGAGNSCGDTGLKHLAVPVPMSRADQVARIRTADHFADSFPDKLKRLPITARRKCVPVLSVTTFPVRTPLACAHPFDQFVYVTR